MFAFIPNKYIVYAVDGTLEKSFNSFIDALEFKEDMEFMFGEGSFEIMSIIN